MHIGIFGKTGSGKSVLARMILLSYMRHEPMSILVLDPQGEFSKMTSENCVGEFVKESCRKEIDVYDLSRLLLQSRRDLFKKILVASGFLRRLEIKHPDNQMHAAEQVLRILNYKYNGAVNSSIQGPTKIWKAYTREAFEHVWERFKHAKSSKDGKSTHPVIDSVYTSPESRKHVLNTMLGADVEEFMNYGNAFYTCLEEAIRLRPPAWIQY